MKTREHYDKENDILSINWGGEVEHSRDILSGQLVLDFNKKDDVVGIELFGFKEEKDGRNDEHLKIAG